MSLKRPLVYGVSVSKTRAHLEFDAPFKFASLHIRRRPLNERGLVSSSLAAFFVLEYRSDQFNDQVSPHDRHRPRSLRFLPCLGLNSLPAILLHNPGAIPGPLSGRPLSDIVFMDSSAWAEWLCNFPCHEPSERCRETNKWRMSHLRIASEVYEMQV
jgi:hypothetical protein